MVHAAARGDRVVVPGRPGSAHEQIMSDPRHNQPLPDDAFGGAGDPSPSLIGRVLGGYRLVALIGAGGMGEVFRAEQVDSGEPAAVKVLRPEYTADRVALKRFVREANVVNDLGHPNIIDIFDVGHDEEHDPPLEYMVLELLRGENLQRAVDRERALDPLSAVRIAAQVADALVAVHRAGVLHRDLKPENIFLVKQPDGQPPLVKLLDFGIVKALDPADDSLITIPGETVGTPEFMPPEQLKGETLDARTEVYTVGLLLFHMLTGRLPFATSHLGRLLCDQLHAPVPPINKKRPTDLAPVPPHLDQLVRRCLHGRRRRRFSTAARLKRALLRCEHRIQRGEDGQDGRRWVNAVLSVLLAGAVLVLWLALR